MNPFTREGQASRQLKAVCVEEDCHPGHITLKISNQSHIKTVAMEFSESKQKMGGLLCKK